MALSLSTTAPDGAALVAVAGELDLASAPELEAELLRVLADASVPEVGVDLREVTYLDSSGLRTLLLAAREADATGRRLRITPGSGQALRVITLAGVADRLNLDAA